MPWSVQIRDKCRFDERRPLWWCSGKEASLANPPWWRYTTPRTRVYCLWHTRLTVVCIITNYMTRHLTYEKDKFPAISAIAREIHLQTRFTYKAGLWLEDITGVCCGMQARVFAEWQNFGHRLGVGLATITLMPATRHTCHPHSVKLVEGIRSRQMQPYLTRFF